MGKGGCLTGKHSVPPVVDGDSEFAVLGSWQAIWSTFQSFTTLHEKKAVGSGRPRTFSPPVVGSGFAWKEIKQHDCAESCWIVIRDKVYDVTTFVPEHPGGRAILAYAGRDATDVFTTFHAGITWNLLQKFYVGQVADPTADAMLSDFRQLRQSLVRRGLFASSKLYYCWKALSNLALFFTAAAILLAGRNSWRDAALAALIFGLGWQQSGWLAHDFLHHQVFKDRRLNNAVGYFFGNFVQGFSVDWWKNKHNTHHAVPNECTPDAEPLDPDIDTLPLLAWHENMLSKVPPAQSALLRYQNYIFFPVLCFARIMWAQQSASHALAVRGRRGLVEPALVAAHYVFLLALAFSTLSVGKAIAFLFASQIFAGFMLALVFVQSHNGMEVYLEQKDFVSAQVVSTRDISSTVWMDWFTGGLNYQIEHHLFPTMPRHNLGKIVPDVAALCARHGLPFETCDMSTGTFRVLRRLADIAAKV